MNKESLKKITSVIIALYLLLTQSIAYAVVDVGIDGQTPDLIAPLINSISVSSNELSPTTPVKVVAEISDELSGFSQGYITYTKPNYQTVNVPFVLNSTTNKYEATITASNTDIAGEWRATTIFLKDKKDNSVYLNNLSTQSNGEKMDFSILSLNVSGVTAPPVSTDKEAPVLHSISVISQQLSVNDKIEINADITDNESGVSTIRANYKKPSGVSQSIYLSKNAAGKFVGFYPIGKYEESGEWILSSVYMIDKDGNSQTVTNYIDADNNQKNFENCKVTVSGTTIDSEAPILHDISVTSQKVKANEKIEVKAEVTDNESGVSTVRVTYKKPSGDTDYFYLYKDTSGQFVGSVMVGQYEEPGTRILTSVYLRDIVGNDKTVTSYLDNNNNTKDFTNCTVEVTGTTPDWEGPELIGGSISAQQISPTQAAVKLVIDVEDSLSGITNSSLTGTYRKPMSGKLYNLNFVKQNNQYTATILIDKYDEIGLWTLENLSIHDALGNYNTSNKTVGGSPFSEFNINVIDGRIAITPGTPNNIWFEAPKSLTGGQTYQLKPMLKSSNSNVADLDITNDSQTMYTTSNPELLTVDSKGFITVPNEAGSGFVFLGVSYGEVKKQVEIKVNNGIIESLLLLQVSPLSTTLHAGQSEQMKVVEINNGARKDITNSSSGIIYTSSNPSLVSITKDGLIQVNSGDIQGTATINIAYHGLVAKTIVKVSKPVVKSLSISPPNETLSLNNKLQLVVKAFMSDGTTKDITEGSTGTVYTSSDGSRATVDANGLIQIPNKAKSGTVTIKAINSNVSVQTVLTINGVPELTGIQATPASVTLKPGDSQKLKIEATYSNGVVVDVSDQATYKSGNSLLANVDSTGLITIPESSTGGNVNIVATFDGKTTLAEVTIPFKPVLESLKFTPDMLTLKPGESHQLGVQANYSDDSTVDVTSKVTYESSDESLVTVDENGFITVNKEAKSGTVYIRGAYGGKGGVATVSIITNTPPTVTSLAFSADKTEVKPGDNTQIKVVATYVDGSTEDVTDQALLNSSNTAKAIVAADTGIVTILDGATGGTVYIRGSYGGKGGAVTITIPSPKTVSTVSFSPDKLTLENGESTEIKVTATYTDGTTEDVTSKVLLTSSNTSQATVNPETGKVTVLEDSTGGIVYIRGSYGGKGGAATLTIPASPSVTSLMFNPSIKTVKPGDTIPLKVTANYSDGTEKEVTAASALKSTNTNLATVDPSTGFVEIPQQAPNGTVYIQGVYGGKGGSAKLTVSKPYITGITFTPGQATIKKGDPLSVQVKANYSDGSVEDVTAQSTFSSSNPAIATVDTSGNVTVPDSSNGGTVYIRGTYGGKGSATTVTVLGPPIVKSLLLTASNDTLNKDEFVQVNATAVYSDGTTEDVTNEVSFSSSNTNLAMVNASGKVTLSDTAKSGTVYIRGVYEGKGGAVTLVIPPQPYIVGLVFDPLSTTLSKGSSLAMKVIAKYSDGETKDVTSKVAFTSSNTNIAIVDETGMVSIPITSSGGTVYIRGSYGGKGAASTVKVQ